MDRRYWSRVWLVGRSVYRDARRLNLDEQAGPAYFEAYALSRWLFWQRMTWAGRQIANRRGQVALDFGCGFGFLLPALRERFEQTVAIDLMPGLARTFCERWDLQDKPCSETTAGGSVCTSGSLRIASTLAEANLAPGSVDLIVALDVLEHFESLDEIVASLTRLLSPTGCMLVSGPTESWLYRLGRRLVGFSGQYHHQSIYDVHSALSQHARQEALSHLPIIAPLFLLSSWRACLASITSP